jgi:hypothetical protein
MNRFGDIVNVSVDTNRKTALVKFVKPESAIASKNSTSPILDNPNIKLSYDPPTEKPVDTPEIKPIPKVLNIIITLKRYQEREI